MAEETAISQTVEVPAKGSAHEPGASGNIIDVSSQLMILTWITFIIMTVILYKVAWKPILKALDLRESSIRKALADAEKARAETAAAEETRRKMIREADVQAQKMLADARAAAEDATRAIEARAREEAKNLVADARREIGAATEKARMELRKETVDLALAMATRCVGKNMDSAANQALVRELTREM